MKNREANNCNNFGAKI